MRALVAAALALAAARSALAQSGEEFVDALASDPNVWAWLAPLLVILFVFGLLALWFSRRRGARGATVRRRP